MGGDASLLLPCRDGGFPHVIDLVRSEHAWPVRAHIELTIDNNRA